MDDLIFCSVAVDNPAYFTQMKRLKQHLLMIYGNPDLLFYQNTYPPGSKLFLDSLYGFKVHAIKEGKNKGYRRVVWLDTAMIPLQKIDFFFPAAEREGVFTVKDSNPIKNVVSNRCLEYFNLKKEYLKFNLIGGSFYIFDFSTEKGNKIFEQWYEAEKAGIFGSQEEESSERLQGHRHDETVLSICQYFHNSKTCNHDRYNNQADDVIITKDHFK